MTDTVVILSSIAYTWKRDNRNIPDTVVILRDQAEEFPLCQQLYSWLETELET